MLKGKITKIPKKYVKHGAIFTVTLQVSTAWAEHSTKQIISVDKNAKIMKIM